eukprot:GEMP01064852.1.p1 GENE.GEMP01064852.1~~GEMP01064852.1.p1  ORF type:complete len:342 (+),score=41.46 GEMP01064852.1:93-1118(+)
MVRMSTRNMGIPTRNMGISVRNMEETQDGGYHLAPENYPVLKRVDQVQNGRMDSDVKGTPENSTTANEYTSTTSSGGNANAPPAGKLFVGGLPISCGTEDLKSYFRKFGRIIDCIVMTHEQKNHPRGFGFVTFAQQSAKTAVLKAYSHHYIHGKWVEVKQSIPKCHMQPSRQIYNNTNYRDNKWATRDNVNYADVYQEELPQPQGRNFNVIDDEYQSSDSINSYEPRWSTADNSSIQASHHITMMQEQMYYALYRTNLMEYEMSSDVISQLSELKATSEKLAQKVERMSGKVANRQRTQQPRQGNEAIACNPQRSAIEDWVKNNTRGADPFGDSPYVTPRG